MFDFYHTEKQTEGATLTATASRTGFPEGPGRCARTTAVPLLTQPAVENACVKGIFQNRGKNSFLSKQGLKNYTSFYLLHSDSEKKSADTVGHYQN